MGPAAGDPDGDLRDWAPTAVPARLTALHRLVAPTDRLELSLPLTLADSPYDEADLVEGAGFRQLSAGPTSVVERVRSLPDTVGPDMAVLICGLNPSPAAADSGVPFGRPGNRFWPAALAAGLVRVDRDPDGALATHGMGMTDLVKRTSRRADELSTDEYRDGFARVDRLVRWLRPKVVVFVGLAGWRTAVNRRAVAGFQPDDLGGVPAYVMPSTSGLNAHSRLEDLTEHLRTARAGPPASRS